MSRANAMHDEHDVCASGVCGAMVHVGHRIEIVAGAFGLSGKLLSSCVHNW